MAATIFLKTPCRADPSFWAGTAEQYAAAAGAARDAIERVVAGGGPRVQLLIGGFAIRRPDGPERLRQQQLLNSGALEFADAISIHLQAFVCRSFGCAAVGDSAEANRRSMQQNLAYFRNFSRQCRGGNSSSVQIWDSETGIHDAGFFAGLRGPGLPPPQCLPRPNFRETAARLVIGEALLQAEGVAAHFYYAQYEVPHEEYDTDMSKILNSANMLDLTLAPRPKLLARIGLANAIAGCALPPQLTRPTEGLWLFEYSGCEPQGRPPSSPGAGRVLLMWSEAGRVAVPVVVSAGAWVTDLFGNVVARPNASATVFASTDPSYLHW